MSTEKNTYTFITGASSGIGRAIAIELSKTRRLILHGRNKQKLEETLHLCSGNSHVIWSYDLSNIDTLQDSFEDFVLESNIAISHFVHAAGIALPCAVRGIDVDYVRRISEINAFSAILLVGSLMKRKVAGGTMRGIVLISSVSAALGTAGSAVYGASKAMLDGFMKSAAVELAPRVRVNSIRPGFVKSRMTEEVLSNSNVAQAIYKRHPLGIGTPIDVARSVAFLLSDESSWITGQCIIVDGGVSCAMSFK